MKSKHDRSRNAVPILAALGLMGFLAACSSPASGLSMPNGGNAIAPSQPMAPITNQDSSTSAATSEPTPANMPLTNACSILTQSEVGGALHQAVLAAKPTTKATGGVINPSFDCLYVGSGQAIVFSFAKSAAESGSAAWMQQQSQFAAEVLANGQTTPVAGLGDWAMWTISNERGGGYAYSKYPYIFGLVVGGKNIDPTTFQTGLKQLAELSINRMPH
jgi:hypothetical protein